MARTPEQMRLDALRNSGIPGTATLTASPTIAPSPPFVGIPKKPAITEKPSGGIAPPGMIGKQPIPGGGMENLVRGDPRPQTGAQPPVRLDSGRDQPRPTTPLPPVAPWLQNPATITAPSVGSTNVGTGGGISVPTLGSAVGAIPQITPPPAPQFQVPAAAQQMIDQYVQKTQQRGSTELQRQLMEDFLPSLKAAAAANGQVNADGTVNGSFLENFTRQQGQVGRELANIVLGAETEGLTRGVQAGQFEQEMGQQSANRAMTASSENARNYLTGAGITSNENIAKSRMALDAQIAGEQASLDRLKISSNENLERARISLQAQVANGQLSMSQANLAFETARAESQNAIDQQKLRLGMLDLLSGREIDIARLGIGAVQDAQGRQRTDQELLTRLSGADLDQIIQTLSAIKGSGGGQTTSGSVLGDVLGAVGTGAALWAAI